MTENMAARGEGLAGLVEKWRERANDFTVTRGDSEVEGAYHSCAAELETAAAAPAGTAPLANERRRDVVEPIAQWLHHQISAACNDKWEEGDNCSDCEQSVMSELFPLLDRALATPSPQAPVTPVNSDLALAHSAFKEPYLQGNLPGATQEQPAGSVADELKVGDPVRVSGILEAISTDGTLIKVNFGMGEYCHPNRLLVHPAPGSPRKVGEDGPCHITIEYGAKALEAVGKPYSIRDARVVAITLNALLRSSSVPVGEQKQEEGV